jgi:XTP/dITP diphosphohydrolase
MKQLLVATRSTHKLREIRTLLRGVPRLRIVDLGDAGLEETADEEGIEAFETFEENALAKARFFHAKTGLPTVADDSGLEVDALDGAPGVHSRRFAPSTIELPREEQDRANNEHLLKKLGDVPLPERTARFVCVAALAASGQDDRCFRGVAEGLILDRPKGWDGFGYDPLFLDRASGKTFAELEPEEKSDRSHRGAAFRALAGYLSDLVAEDPK